MFRYDVDLRESPLDLRLCVTSGQVFRWRFDSGHWHGVDGATWFRVLETPTHLVVESNHAIGEFESLFQLDLSLQELQRDILEIGPELHQQVGVLAGLRLLRPSDAVEEMFCFLCTPNNHLSRITQMVETLSTFGPEFEDAPYRRWPTLETIAELGEDVLRSRGFGYRARTIPTIARDVLARGGRPWLESLRTAPYEVARKALLEIDFIGPKLADCICLFALHHTEATPIDTHVHQAFCRLYRPDLAGKALTPKRYEEMANAFRSRFGRLSGYAHQYLFYDNLLRSKNRAKGSIKP